MVWIHRKPDGGYSARGHPGSFSFYHFFWHTDHIFHITPFIFIYWMYCMLYDYFRNTVLMKCYLHQHISQKYIKFKKRGSFCCLLEYYTTALWLQQPVGLAQTSKPLICVICVTWGKKNSIVGTDAACVQVMMDCCHLLYIFSGATTTKKGHTI